LIIRPDQPFFCQCKIARRLRSALACRLTCRVRLQAQRQSSSDACTEIGSKIPALLIRTSMRPSRRSSAMSQSRSAAPIAPRSPPILAVPSSRAWPSTRAPLDCRVPKVARPMPREEPVTKTWTRSVMNSQYAMVGRSGFKSLWVAGKLTVMSWGRWAGLANPSARRLFSERRFDADSARGSLRQSGGVRFEGL
jgi:hypothetical protein